MYKYIALLFLSPIVLTAQDQVSNADLSKKLDLILQKVGGLEERVSQLESENAQVKKEVKQATQSAKEAKSATENLAIPQNEEEKKSFLNKLRIDLKSEEVKAKGPWTKAPETWQSMKRILPNTKLDNFSVSRTILSSLNPRIDQSMSTLETLNSDGEEEEATVQFFRDRVISYTSPF